MPGIFSFVYDWELLVMNWILLALSDLLFSLAYSTATPGPGKVRYLYLCGSTNIDLEPPTP